MINRILHASVIVADTARSLEFYRDVLGLRVDESRPDLGYPGAWLTINEQQQIHLLELPNPDPTDGRPVHGGRDRHTALAVSDFAALVDTLSKRRIPYTLSRSGRQALFVRDPDGNTLELIADESR